MTKTITRQFIDGLGVSLPDFAPGQVVEILETYPHPTGGQNLYYARNIVTGARFYPTDEDFAEGAP